MATSKDARLAPVNAREGVNTRKQGNWASAVARPRETICRSDMIIGLGCPTAQWGDMMTGMYRNRSTNSGIASTQRDDVLLYADMADEPWKYGDADMSDWLDLHEQLSGNPKRHAYWQDREFLQQAEQERQQERYAIELNNRRDYFRSVAKEAAKLAMKRWVERDIKLIVNRFKGAATKIQTLVRGYQTRCKDAHQDCCMCLSHRISPLKTEVGYMCRDCAELGPYEDLVEEDPWNWHRAEYVDEAPNHHVYDTCSWCNQEFFAPLYCGDYCSGGCEWKDRTA